MSSSIKELNRKFDVHVNEIWAIIHNHQNILQQVAKNSLKRHTNQQSQLVTLDSIENPLVFCDGATLEIGETLGLQNGSLFLHKYTYQYKKEDVIYFRYDKHKANNISSNMTEQDWEYYHPLCHLHAVNEEPRYRTHETNFCEIFNMIRLNFYNPHN